MEKPALQSGASDCTIKLCSSFDEDCFHMTSDQHQMCAKSLPIVCSSTGIDPGDVFEPKDGHCPFERP